MVAVIVSIGKTTFVTEAATRLPRHTGEHVAIEPLSRFLRRASSPTPDGASIARPTWRPSLDDYDRSLGIREDEAA